MENMDKGLTVPNWVLINWTKTHQIPQNLSAQAQKFGISMKKGFKWASIVRGFGQRCTEGPRIMGTPVHTFWFTLLQKWGHATEHALWRGIFETINYFQTRE